MTADTTRLAALRSLVRNKPGRSDREAADRTALDHNARELVGGVRRHMATIDAVVQPFVHQPLDRIEAELREALRIGVWGLLFDRRTPPPLTVAAAVELAGPTKRRRGFLNAVLRKIAGELRFEPMPSEPIRARDTIIVDATTVARLPTPVLADPAIDLKAYLAAQYSVPRWFAAMMEPLLGDAVDAFLASCNRAIPLALRVNRLRATPDEAAAALRSAGVDVLRILGDVIEVRFDGQITTCSPFRDGLVTVQDLVASEVAPFVGAAEGERILDLCAGVGGKSLHLAEVSAGKATVVAADTSAVQLARLQENVTRLRTPNVTILQLDAGPGTELVGPFDRVLVDAPCSNSGVLMKRIEARWRLDPETVAKLGELQLDLLKRAAPLVKPGGILVYSTCSVLRQENEAVVRRFVTAYPDFTVEATQLRFPHVTTRDGGFMARLVKKA